MVTPSATILVGDCRDLLKKIPSESIQAVVTSPPYWGLRDYESISWAGGQKNCEHQNAKPKAKAETAESKRQKNKTQRVCSCGAAGIDSAVGGEYSPDEYVEQLCLIFDEIHRVLKSDGTLWINLGDTYATKDIRNSDGLVIKRKNLLGMPWRVALALQSRGWILRQDIIWVKPNAMPEG